MADVSSEVANAASSTDVGKVVWGLLLVWTGAVLFLHWGWGVGLVGAGVLLLAAQAARRYLRLEVEGFGLVAGALLVICGAGSLLEVAVDLIPVLCVLAGIALLVSTWTARRRPGAGGPAEPRAPSSPRV